ncbi:hypothetical protein [Rhodococcus globerulus]|uniref:Uncharacterized protein n=1 Tax=Rhodococcus globerulus TaxID=33008 RepID=A0ABU4C3U9_RHOGO|nr:hypothetical protein [Rhodococcus globerulus]MDV6271099.1 hypothetical protein [Rhodococcus globerulus]
MELEIYEVEVNGRIATLQLSAADAKARGLTPQAKAATPANKSRSRSRTKAV